MQPQPHTSNGDENEPRDDLDVAYSIIRPSEYNDLLEQLNLGTGYYSEDDLNMQMRNIRKGLVTDIAFSENLRKRAVQETKVKIAEEGFNFYDERSEEPKVWLPLKDRHIDEHGRTTALFERGEEIWDELSDPRYALSVKQAAALAEKTNLDSFKSIFHHLTAAYHETTKSKGARTQDNYFGRVQRREIKGDADEAGGHFLGRKRRNS